MDQNWAFEPVPKHGVHSHLGARELRPVVVASVVSAAILTAILASCVFHAGAVTAVTGWIRDRGACAHRTACPPPPQHHCPPPGHRCPPPPQHHYPPPPRHCPPPPQHHCPHPPDHCPPPPQHHCPHPPDRCPPPPQHHYPPPYPARARHQPRRLRTHLHLARQLGPLPPWLLPPWLQPRQ